MKITSGIKKTVATIDEHHSVLEAARLMTEDYIGSVVVTSHSRIVGIFTERELMMRVVGKGRDPSAVKIKDVMHTDHLKIGPDATCEEALNTMQKKRCRHLLVYDGDEFIGLISLRDIVVLTLQEKDDLINQLQVYISAT
jgi:CBS domain-containing protein